MSRQDLAIRLANYKKMHTKTAEQKGCAKEFLETKTLTQARKVLWGMKRKNIKGAKNG